MKRLMATGFSEPIVADSGNGYHLLFKVHISTDDRQVVADFLSVLDMWFSTDEAKIDTAVYNPSRITKLYGTIAAKGAHTLIEVPVKLAAFYGLRRSEVMGLRWDAVDFVHNTICIRHTVTGCTIDGQYQIIAADTTKTRSSRRTLPLVPTVREMLLRLKEQQEQNRKICGQSYSREFADYICVNKLGGTDSPSISFQLFQQSAGTKPLAAYPLSRPAPQLRNAAAGAWCAAQTDSGVAGAQRFQHDSQHLRAP